MKWSANLAWQIDITESAAKQLSKMDKSEAKRITTFLRQRLAVMDDPRSTGKGLTGPLGGLWRYRVGDYRIVCEINNGSLNVLVVKIGSRKEVYR
jgi:mRNA interferase RelE/StbE